MTYIDQNGKTWTRSQDMTTITCEDGMIVIGQPEMSFEHMVSEAYRSMEPIKSDAERIAELEAQVAALIARLS